MKTYKKDGKRCEICIKHDCKPGLCGCIECSKNYRFTGAFEELKAMKELEETDMEKFIHSKF